MVFLQKKSNMSICLVYKEEKRVETDKHVKEKLMADDEDELCAVLPPSFSFFI